jgi:DNA-directed RNA polymerase subunit beta'
LAKTSAAPVQTTIGRLMLQSSVPERMRSQRFLTDPKLELDENRLNTILSNIARSSDHQEFSTAADKLKDMGYRHATGFSFGLKDLVVDNSYRDEMFRQAREAEEVIRKKEKNKEARDEKLVNLYDMVGKKVLPHAKRNIERSENRLYDWVKSGAKGKWSQFHQMTVAPIQVVDSDGKSLPVPIDKSYAEGLDSASYYASMYGARMGTIGRVKGTADPGYLTKQLMQASMDTLITNDDCGTTKGAVHNVDDPNVLDRFTTRDVKLGTRGGKDKGVIPKGTLVTPAVVSRLRNNKVKDVPVRTPLKCAESHGICSKCFGLNENGQTHRKGVNIGVIATHALGEPLTQMSMNAFHTGGVAGAAGSKAKSEFQRVEELVKFQKVPGAAVLSSASGKVSDIKLDKPTGGYRVKIGDTEEFVPALKGKPTVRVGQDVKKGDSLSRGPKDPRELLPLTSIGTVQRYVTDELSNLYRGSSAIHRRNAEVVVRNLTNLSEVKDPGDMAGVLRGDKMPTSQVEAFNRNLKEGQKPVSYQPILKSVDLLPTEIQKDWIARLQSRELKRTLLDAVSEGWSSDVHSVHPIPGMAYGKEFGKGSPAQPFFY